MSARASFPTPVTADRPAAEKALRSAAAAPLLTLFAELGSSPRGLTEAAAAVRAVPGGRPRRVLPVLAFGGPFVLLLTGLGVVFALLGDVRGWVTVAVMVAISVGLRWLSARRARQAIATLSGIVAATASVRRRAADGAVTVTREVPVDDLVAGDVVELAAGEVVPADVRVLRGRGFRVDQSVLSGESHPVAKDGALHRRAGAGAVPVLGLPSIAFAGSMVVSGRATGLVLASGQDTVMGAAERAAVLPRKPSSVDRGVRQVGGTLLRFMLVLVPLVVVVARGGVPAEWTQAGLFALAVAVGLTPELLPAIVTAGLARGAAVLARRGLVVNRLEALGDLGGMDVLCVDKTGTLTSDRVAVAHSIDVDGRLDPTAVEYAYLVTRFQSGPPDAVDDAVAADVDAAEELLAGARCRLVAEIPFDYERRRAGVVLRGRDGGQLIVTRGDPEEVLARCTRVRRGTAVVPLTGQLRAVAFDSVAAHESHGMRLLAVAARDGHGHGPQAEQALVLVGFVALLDPLRDGVREVLAELTARGVQVKVLTGDSPRVARHVAGQAGLAVHRMVLGRDVDGLGEAALAALVAEVDVFAQVTPAQKARIVDALHRRGRCVGFLGDGVNDVAALRAADVGICVAGASLAARAAADMLLLRPDLAAVASGVVEGRRTLGNTMKYVKLTAASNLGNVISIVAAVVVLPFLPMLPIQLLTANLLYDAAQLALPFDRVDGDYLASPRRWDTARLGRFMLVFGPLSSVFDLATFAVLARLLPLGDPAGQAMFQAGWFAEGLLTQLLVLLVLRGRRLSLPAAPVAVASGLALVLAVVIPLSRWGTWVGFAAPPPIFLVWLAVIVVAYLAAAVAARSVFVARTGDWL